MLWLPLSGVDTEIKHDIIIRGQDRVNTEKYVLS